MLSSVIRSAPSKNKMRAVFLWNPRKSRKYLKVVHLLLWEQRGCIHMSDPCGLITCSVPTLVHTNKTGLQWEYQHPWWKRRSTDNRSEFSFKLFFKCFPMFQLVKYVSLKSYNNQTAFKLYHRINWGWMQAGRHSPLNKWRLYRSGILTCSHNLMEHFWDDECCGPQVPGLSMTGSSCCSAARLL